MAKLESKRLNIRIRREVAWQLEALAEAEGISQTEVIERAILAAANGDLGSRSVMGTQQAVTTKPTPVIRSEVTIFCAHCREPFGGQKFQPPLCSECKQSGHRQNPANCPVCMDMGTGAL